MAWMYLIIASLFEVCWIFSVKFITWGNLLKIDYFRLQHMPREYLISLLAFIGYIIFGVANIALFSVAIKDLPASIAYAVWMSLALVGSWMIDIVLFKNPYSHWQALFVLLILVGVVGLKLASEGKI